MEVIYSTFSGEAIKQRVLAKYGLADPVECLLFHRGLNDTYLVNAGEGKLALRLYRRRWRTEEAIRGEVAALLHLDGLGVALAAPVPAADGEWVTDLDAPEGRRCAVLFHWVNGSQPRYIDAAHAGLYGELAARMHIAGDSMPSDARRAPLDMSYLLERPVASLRPLLESQPLLASRFDALVERVSTQLERSRDRLWDWGFCHGDMHGGNANLDGGRLALFDFDCCGPGWRVYDLATYRWAARIRGVATQAWTPFIEAYLKIRPVARDTLEYVPLFVVLRHLWLQGYHAWDAVESGRSYQSGRYLEDLVSFLEKLESEPL